MQLIKQKTILVRAYTVQNCGDDMFLRILFERFPQTKMLLLVFPKQIKLYEGWLKKYPNISLLLMPMPPFIKKCFLKIISFFDEGKIREACLSKKYFNYFSNIKNEIDAFVYIIGSMSQQYKSGFSMGHKSDLIIVSALADKPKYLLGANFGPFIDDAFREYYKTVFRQYNDICFRDYKSYNYFKELPQVRYEKDIVFSLNYNNIEKEKGSIGLSIIDLLAQKAAYNTRKAFKDSYLRTIIGLIERFLSENRPIYLFPFSCCDGDEDVIKFVLNKLSSCNRSKVKIIKYKGNLDLFISEYMRVETMIVTRFHAMILSLLAGQYMYPLAYDQKMCNVLQDLHYNDKFSEISNIAPIEEIILALKSKNFVLPYSSVRESAERQFVNLDRFINS
jgi:colanic acid/amylovoran biosynthesis protein